MSSENLEKSIVESFEKSFEKIKRVCRYPPITGPKIIYDQNLQTTAYLDLLDLEIAINPYFAIFVAKNGGENLETILDGLFEHEFGHYIFFPFDHEMYVFLSHTIKEKFGEKWAHDIFGLYIDLIDNCLMNYEGVSRGNINKLLEANFKAIKSTKGRVPSSLVAILLAYKELMQKAEGAPQININIDISEFGNKEDIKKAVNRIKNLLVEEGRNYGIQYKNIKEFGEAILPLLEYDKEHDLENKSNHKAITKEVYDRLSGDKMRKIDEAIERLAKKLPKDIYQKIKRHYHGTKNLEPDQGAGIGLGSENTKLADEETIDYYLTLAKQYGIYIRPKRGLSIGKSEMPLRVTNWDPSKSLSRVIQSTISPFPIPGHTKVIEDEEVPHISEKDITPKAIIYKDVSGSMPDPRKTKCYATIAAAIIALSYLRSGGEVCVALFDDGSDELFGTRDERKLMEYLCGYKGGGTRIDIEKLIEDFGKEKEYIVKSLSEEEIKKNPEFRAYIQKLAKIGKLPEGEGNIDLYIITDGGIDNLDEVIDFLKENPQYRPTIIHTGHFDLDISGYDNETSGVYEGILVLRIKDKKDIIKMAKKRLQETLLSKYTYVR